MINTDYLVEMYWRNKRLMVYIFPASRFRKLICCKFEVATVMGFDDELDVTDGGS